MKKEFGTVASSKHSALWHTYIGWICETDAGRSLYDAFKADGGIFAFDNEQRSRASYATYANAVILTNRTTPSDIVHELGHARQMRLRPDVLKVGRKKLHPLTAAHIDVLIEADCWAISSIFDKQFIRVNRDDVEKLAAYMKADRKHFVHSRNVVPVKFEGDRRQYSALEIDVVSAIKYLHHLAQGLDGESGMDEFIEWIAKDSTDADWAVRAFKASFRDSSFKDGFSNSYQYAGSEFTRYLQDLVLHVNNDGGHNLRNYKGTKEWGQDDFFQIVKDLSDLRDIGIDKRYVDLQSDLTWCTGTPDAVMQAYKDMLETLTGALERRKTETRPSSRQPS